MRPLTSTLALTLLCTLAFGCSSHTPSDKPIDTKPAILWGSAQDVLKLTVAATTKITPKTDAVNLRLDDNVVDVWLVPTAPTVNEAIAKVPDVIKDEFKNFKTTSTTTLTIAGNQATHLMGTGEEADDGDAGTADVIVFKVGDHVFVSCTHGESLTTEAQQWMLTVIQTSQRP